MGNTGTSSKHNNTEIWTFTRAHFCLSYATFPSIKIWRKYLERISSVSYTHLYKVNTHYSSFNVEIVDSQAKYLRMRKKGEEEQNDCIISPMPGKVVKIPVAVGQEMKAGDTAIVIEAMKMQSNYKVTSDCRIKEILVQEGDNITGDQTLITLEPIA